MGSLTPLERLLQHQVHLAQQGELPPQDVQQLLLDLLSRGEPSPGAAFLCGYASALLGIQLNTAAAAEARWRQWHLFGRVKGLDRRGERAELAQLLQHPATLLDLLTDPAVAAQALPCVVPTLFWCGDLRPALRAIQYLAAHRDAPAVGAVVDAAIADLIARLAPCAAGPHGAIEPGEALALLDAVQHVAGYAELPTALRAQWHQAMAAHWLANSGWTQTEQHAARALALHATPALAADLAVLRALAALRLHRVDEFAPCPRRPEREVAQQWLAAGGAPARSAPQHALLSGLLAYEIGDARAAIAALEQALVGMPPGGATDAATASQTAFYLAAALLAEGCAEESSRALRLMREALPQIRPDLESFYAVHEALKKLDRKLALQFLDRVDIGRGSSPDQLLFVALEFLSLGEAAPAAHAARRVLEVAVDLDQRLEALRVVLTAHNMQGESDQARACYAEMRELLLHRGAFEALERLLKNETAVGQALDHVEIKLELVNLYEEMEGRDCERAHLQAAVARSLRARKEVDALRQAHALLQEVALQFPALAEDDLAAVGRLLEHHDEAPPSDDLGARWTQALTQALGRRPRVLVVGGNERQRKHHPRLQALGSRWGFDGEWLMTNYIAPQRIVSAVADRLRAGVDIVMLLHWNRHETTEPVLELVRKAGVAGRTVHYAGFTSLQVALTELLEKLTRARDGQSADRG